MAMYDAGNTCVVTKDDEHGLAYKNTIDQWLAERRTFIAILVAASLVACFGTVLPVLEMLSKGNISNAGHNILYWVGICVPAL
nr:hypothetical protein [Candidatus Sigynarchaeota archaeon]